ncbi:MAG: hypothetical protein PF689_03170, partial [Deltaproteobacteria bacterium]|nr:hypothetical protein [Deltaproteobacteria bacterium]
MTNKLNNAKKIGFEIKIKVNDALIQSGWFTKICINAGDSHLFPLLFPIPEAQDSSPRNLQEIKQIKKRGIKLRSCFSTKTGNRIYSFGFPLIRKSSSGDYKLRILKKMKATVDGEKFNNKTREYQDITLEPLAEGTIYGKDEWTLEFRWIYYKSHQFEKNPVVTPFFGQALIYSFILVFGLLYLGFLEKKDLEIDFDHTSHSKRLVKYEKSKKKKEKETIIEEKIEEVNKKPVLKTALLNRKIQRKTKKLATPKKIELKFLFDKNKNNSPISKENTPGSKNTDLDQEGDGEETTDTENQESSGLANAGNGGNTGLPTTTPSFNVKAPPNKAVKAPPRIKVR